MRRPLVVNPKLALLCATACVVAALLPADGSAHHSVAAGFDTQQMIELEGELTGIRWQNPHILLTLVVAGSDGRAVSWELESLSANGIGRTGIVRDMFRLGDRVKVAGNPSRRGLERLWAVHILLPTNQELVLGALQRPPRWSEQVLRGTEASQTNEGTAANVELGIFRVWSSSVNFRTRSGNEDPASVPWTPEGRAAVERARSETDPAMGCVTKGMPRIMTQPYPIEFVQQGDRIELKIEEYDAVRTIHVGPGAGESAGAPSALGHSVGRWEGSALVVTTTNLAGGLFDGVGATPVSSQVTLTERFAPSADGAHLDYSLTIADPVYRTEPATVEKRWLNVPGVQVLPYECKR